MLQTYEDNCPVLLQRILYGKNVRKSINRQYLRLRRRRV